jgi:uncharacterized protein YuzE
MSLLTIKFPDGAVLKYDPVAHIAYIKVRDGIVHETRQEAPNILVDVDAKGHLIGVEIISPKTLKYETKLMPILKRISKEFGVPQLREINPQLVPGIYQPA